MELHNDIGKIRDLSPLHIQRAYENLKRLPTSAK